MNDAANEVATAARMVRVHSPTEFEILGVPHETPQGSGGNEASVVSKIRDVLYWFFCRYSLRSPYSTPDPLVARRFLARLSEANAGSGSWDPGWRIMALDEDGRFEVTKDGLSFWVVPDGILPQGGELRSGSRASIRIPKELRALAPGFYFAIGDAPQPDPPPEIITRLYWHLTAEVADHAIHLLTSTLNRLQVPFRLKVLADPQAFTRADAGVLYLDRRMYPEVRDSLWLLHGILAPSLLPDVPWFVKRLARGLGVAEDPQGLESFGQHRCRLVAEGVWAAWRTGRDEPEQRIDAVRLAFSSAGFDPDQPYLAPGSSDEYAFAEG
jgi:HopA1 effector protein family